MTKSVAIAVYLAMLAVMIFAWLFVDITGDVTIHVRPQWARTATSPSAR